MRIKSRATKETLLVLTAVALILLTLLTSLHPLGDNLAAEEGKPAPSSEESEQNTSQQTEPADLIPPPPSEITESSEEANESTNSPAEIRETTETSPAPFPQHSAQSSEEPKPSQNDNGQITETTNPGQATENPQESTILPGVEEIPQIPQIPQIPEEDIFTKIPGRLNILLPVSEQDLLRFPQDKLLNFNPYLCQSEFSQWVSRLLYVPLITKSEENSFDLLEGYQYKVEEKELRLVLDDNLYWGDGSVLSARDLHFTFSSLLKNPQLHPAGEILKHLKQADKISKAEKEDEADKLETENQVIDVNPRPFANISGIVSHNDKELSLYFRKKLSEEEIGTLLSVVVLPTQAWWSANPQRWSNLEALPIILENSQANSTADEIETEQLLNAKGENPFFDAASYELYAQIFDENKEILEFKALEKYLSQSTIPRALDARISIKPELTNNLSNALLQSGADLAVFPSLSEEEEQALSAAGYELSDVESRKLVLVEINSQLENNLWINKEMRKALLSLLPSAKELRAENYSKLRAPVLNAEEIGENAFWQSYLKAGYYTNNMPEDLLAKAQEQNATLAGEFRLLYNLNDDDAEFLARKLEARFNTLGIYPICYGVNTNDLAQLSGELDLADIFVHTENSFLFRSSANTLPAYQKIYKMASKDIDEPLNLLLFQK